MWDFATRIVRTVSDVTVGTVIVMVHVALAERQAQRPVHEVQEVLHRRRARGTLPPLTRPIQRELV